MLNKNTSEFLFRSLFCTIFMGLGMEHIFSDQIIQNLMPSWIDYPRAVSFGTGIFLVIGGGLIFLGYKLKIASIMLGMFLIAVTISVHLPAVLTTPKNIPEQWDWMWVIMQRSNFVKNICLLGVCFHLFHHPCGYYSLEEFLKRKKATP